MKQIYIERLILIAMSFVLFVLFAALCGLAVPALP